MYAMSSGRVTNALTNETGEIYGLNSSQSINWAVNKVEMAHTFYWSDVYVEPGHFVVIIRQGRLLSSPSPEELNRLFQQSKVNLGTASADVIRYVHDKAVRIYRYCLSEACKYSDQDAFVLDLALSSIWEDDEYEIPPERMAWLKQIWLAEKRTVKDICKAVGFTQRELADHFSIPLRTVENWCMGTRSCPIYTRLMMQELLGLVSRYPTLI